MKKLIQGTLALIMAASLFGCGSSPALNGTAGTGNTPTTKPETRKVEITSENWQDYFETTYRLVKSNPDKDYYQNYNMEVKLKDAYAGELADSNISEVTFTARYDLEFFHATLNGDQLEIGDVVDAETVDLSAYNGWETGFIDEFKAMWNTHGRYERTETLSNGELNSGKDILSSTLQRGLLEDLSGEEPSDEAVWAVTGPVNVEIEASGTLYLNE